MQTKIVNMIHAGIY